MGTTSFNITFQNPKGICLKMAKLCNIILGTTLVFAALLPLISAKCQPGGVCGPYPASDNMIRIADKVRPQVEAKANGGEPYPEYEVIQYKEQVVIEVTYWIKYWILIKVSEEEKGYIQIDVFETIAEGLKLLQAQTGLTEDHVIS